MAEATETLTRPRLSPLMSDLVFNYVCCARAYRMPLSGEKAGQVNEEEEELAFKLLLDVLNADYGEGTFTRADLEADIADRS